MIAIDANILVYADREESPYHVAARSLLENLVYGGRPWALPWPSVYSFLRVVTHPTIFRPPTPMAEAWAGVMAIMASPSVRLLTETDRHAEMLGTVLADASVAGNLAHDAHIAALLMEHGVSEILTADDDFRRFPALKVTNPFLSKT